MPIGRSLRVLPGLVHEELFLAVEAIERVHGTGDLPPIPMSFARLKPVDPFGRARRGEFVFLPTGEPVRIVVDSDYPHRLVSAIHEVGHFIDFAGIGVPGRFESSTESDALTDWRQAVPRTSAVRDLAEIATTAETPVDRNIAFDLLELSELWARSYCQYVVARRQSAMIQASLRAIRDPGPRRVYFPVQWGDADFAPIDEVIESLFRRLRWRSD